MSSPSFFTLHHFPIGSGITSHSADAPWRSCTKVDFPAAVRHTCTQRKHLNVCRDVDMVKITYLRNVSNTVLNAVYQEDIRQFWRQKRIPPFTINDNLIKFPTIWLQSWTTESPYCSIRVSNSPMFPSIETFFPLRETPPLQFLLSPRQRILFGGVDIFERISRFRPDICLFGLAPRENSWPTKFKYHARETPVSGQRRVLPVGGAISDKPIETPCSTPAFNTWCSTPLSFQFSTF